MQSFPAYPQTIAQARFSIHKRIVGGAIVTLAGVAILSIQAALLTLGAFIASGLPMIVGSITRYLIARDEAKRAMLDEVKQ